MSEVKLVIRDANEDRSGTVHGSVAEWFIAALSADPVSLTELDAAVDRFALESPTRGHSKKIVLHDGMVWREPLFSEFTH